MDVTILLVIQPITAGNTCYRNRLCGANVSLVAQWQMLLSLFWIFSTLGYKSLSMMEVPGAKRRWKIHAHKTDVLQALQDTFCRTLKQWLRIWSKQCLFWLLTYQSTKKIVNMLCHGLLATPWTASAPYPTFAPLFQWLCVFLSYLGISWLSWIQCAEIEQLRKFFNSSAGTSVFIGCLVSSA